MGEGGKEKAPIGPALEFFAGTLAGVGSLFVGHPFDTIKVRLQCQQKNQLKYSNAFHALSSILREEKVSGLYKGVMSPLAGVALINASVFGFYGVAMRLQLNSPNDSPTLTQITIAGTFSGLFTSIITTPIERLKILQQSAPSTSAQPTLYHLLSNSSIKSLYRGLTATLLRDSGYGPYFLTYEAISRGWPSSGQYKSSLAEEVLIETSEVSWTRLLFAGGAAGIVGWGSTFGMDVVKSRIQASEPYIVVDSSSSGESKKVNHPFKSTWSTIRNSYKGEGMKVFTAGLGPTLLRAVPVNMVCFFVYEAVVEGLR